MKAGQHHRDLDSKATDDSLENTCMIDHAEYYFMHNTGKDLHDVLPAEIIMQLEGLSDNIDDYIDKINEG